MKIAHISRVGKRPVYDLSVSEVEHYILENGVVTHNTGIMYSANQVFIISKAQDADGTGADKTLNGFKFTINIEKSRYVKEKSKLPFTVLFDGGIQKWSSMFELALEAGFLIKPKNGWYQIVDGDTGEVFGDNYREKEIRRNDEFFQKLVASNKFKAFIEDRYKLSALSSTGSASPVDDDDEEDDE